MTIRPSQLFKRHRTALLVMLLTVAGQSLPLPSLAVSEAVKSWEQVQKRASAAFDANQYKIAEDLLNEAVVKARATFGQGDLHTARSAGELGQLLTIRGRFSEAEPYLEEELRAKALALGTSNGQMIQAMGSLVRFYLLYGTASKAEDLTDEILDFIEGKIKEQNAQINAQGKLKLQKGVPLDGWAGQAAPAMRDPLLEWAITCDDLGNLYRLRGEYDTADRLYKAALDTKATILGKEHLSLANSYDSLGVLCLDKKEYEDAESYFADALEITERIQPPEHPQVYDRLDKLARCLILEKKYEEAEQLYLRAQTLWKADPRKSGNQCRALYALGSLYAEEKKWGSAAPVLARALRLSEKINGTWSINLVPYLQRYGYVLYYCGQRGASESMKARALAIAPVVPALKVAAPMKLGVWSVLSKPITTKGADGAKASADTSSRPKAKKSKRTPRKRATASRRHR